MKKMQKKKGIGLILTVIIILIIAVLITVTIILIRNINSNQQGEQANSNNSVSSGTSNKPNKSFSLEDFNKNNENIDITNFVDTEYGFYFKYPIYIELSDYNIMKARREDKVMVRRQDYEKYMYNSINSALGEDGFRVIVLKETETPENMVEIIKSRYSYLLHNEMYKYGEVRQIKLISKFTSNNTQWGKYEIVFEKGNRELIYVTANKSITVVLSFEAIDKEENKYMSDELWNVVVVNKEAIADYIAKSFVFTNDLEYMLNLKEARVLYYNTLYERSRISLFDSKGTGLEIGGAVPGVASTGGAGYVKASNVNIENAWDTLLNNNLNTKEYEYKVIESEDAITLKDLDGNEYKVKYYEYERTSKDPKYSKYTSDYITYVFVTDKYYGYVGEVTNKYRYALDFDVKNLSFRDMNEGYWDVTKFIE